MRILILSANTGEGHNSAARALKEYFEQRGSSCRIEDGLAYMGRSSNALICKSHVFLYRSLPKVYGMGYRIEEQQARRQRYQQKLCAKVNRRRSRSLPKRKRSLRALLSLGGFDAVICVHVFAARLVSELRLSGQVRIPAFFLATDYTCSPGVNQLDVDAWLIPHAALIPEFSGYGIPEDKLIPTGIPVRAAFLERADKRQARRDLGLPEDKRIAVLSCGSMGAGPMGRMVLTLVEALPKDALLVVICGNNHALEKSLRGLVHSKKLLVLGFTGRMPEYMDAADLFITKPGGLSTTEAVFKRVPLILINAVPGCETRNMAFMESLGCALQASGAISLARMAAAALNSDASLEALSENCAREFTQNAAERIYSEVEAVCRRYADADPR